MLRALAQVIYTRAKRWLWWLTHVGNTKGKVVIRRSEGKRKRLRVECITVAGDGREIRTQNPFVSGSKKRRQRGDQGAQLRNERKNSSKKEN